MVLQGEYKGARIRILHGPLAMTWRRQVDQDRLQEEKDLRLF